MTVFHICYQLADIHEVPYIVILETLLEKEVAGKSVQVTEESKPEFDDPSRREKAFKKL